MGSDFTMILETSYLPRRLEFLKLEAPQARNFLAAPTCDEIAADEAAAREDAELAELEDAEAMPPA